MTLERSLRFDFTRPGDEERLLRGLNLRVYPQTEAWQLITVANVPHDSLALYCSGIDPANVALAYPTNIFWEVHEGIDCNDDDALPVATGITNLKSAADVAGRHGYLFRITGLRGNSYSLWARLDAGATGAINVLVRAISKEGGTATPSVSVGSAIG